MPGLFLVAAAALILRDDGCLLLMRRSALKDFAPGVWETPNGRLERGETVLAALHREVMEETGLTVEAIRPVDTWRIVRGPENQEMIGITYLCRPSGAREVRLSLEHDAYQWVRPEDVSAFHAAPAVGDLVLGLLDAEPSSARLR